MTYNQIQFLGSSSSYTTIIRIYLKSVVMCCVTKTDNDRTSTYVRANVIWPYLVLRVARRHARASSKQQTIHLPVPELFAGACIP
jgi:hypothetical protein